MPSGTFLALIFNHLLNLVNKGENLVHNFTKKNAAPSGTAFLITFCSMLRTTAVLTVQPEMPKTES